MKIYVEAENATLLPLLQESLNGEHHRLQMSLKRAKDELRKFEEQYQ